MYPVVKGKLHEFLTSNPTFKAGHLLKCTCGQCYGGFFLQVESL